MNQRYCSIKEVSKYTSLPKTTLYEWAAQRRIPSIKIGRRILFDLQDIDQLMEKLKRVQNTAEATIKKVVGEVQDHGV